MKSPPPEHPNKLQATARLLRYVRKHGAQCLALGGLVFLLVAVPGAAVVTDLGQGLNYLRIGSPRKSGPELTEALQRPQALIVDLRYPASETDSLAELRALSGPSSNPKLYLLVSPETPGAIAELVATTQARAVVLGVKGSHPEPQVIVEQSSKDDREAYEALEAGTALPDLISGKVDKERFDEASLVSEFKSGNHDARPAAAPTTPARAKVTRPTDRVLQRAVHLHRALQALKRG